MKSAYSDANFITAPSVSLALRCWDRAVSSRTDQTQRGRTPRPLQHAECLSAGISPEMSAWRIITLAMPLSIVFDRGAPTGFGLAMAHPELVSRGPLIRQARPETSEHRTSVRLHPG